VNRAVNQVKPGEPTLIQRVTSLEAEQARHRDWTHQSMCAIAHQLGIQLNPIPNPRRPHEPTIERRSPRSRRRSESLSASPLTAPSRSTTGWQSRPR
jgi:hypothetical protein